MVFKVYSVLDEKYIFEALIKNKGVGGVPAKFNIEYNKTNLSSFDLENWPNASK